MPRTDAYSAVHEIALEQHGLFTAEQARQIGLDPRTISAMAARRRRIRRLSFGLYQDLGAPETRWTEYMKAVLWPNGVVGVLSHDTALDLMNLSDVNPHVIHVTVPRRHRVRRRRPPEGILLHHVDLPDGDVGSIEGIPVTKAARTIRDCATRNIGPALLRQAIDDAVSGGWLPPMDAEALRRELTSAGKL